MDASRQLREIPCRWGRDPLGKDIIHSVTNPLSKPTGALHFYGGDLFEVERSEWEPEHLREHAYDLVKLRAMFDM